MRCSRCHRVLTRAPIQVGLATLGPRCAALVGASKPKKRRVAVKAPAVDSRQGDLFAQEVRP